MSDSIMTEDGVSPNLDSLVRQVLTSRVYEASKETPLDPANKLSRRLRNNIKLKREDLQPIFSFKIRGAYNKIAQLSPQDQRKGVITASAGNHAQGVAFAAERLGLRAVIVMPQTTAAIKIEAVRAMGGEVVLEGDSFADAMGRCEDLARKTGLIFVHPFDDPLVVAGQGTIGDEILRQSRGQLDAVFVPIGGGGLIAGIAGFIKALNPTVKIIGVEPFEADAMYRSLEAGRRIQLDHVGIFADGVAVREVGEYTMPIAQATVDEVVRVTNDEICAALKDIFDETRTIMEPAGALAVAGLKSYVEREKIRDKHLVALLSGANMNFDRLRFVAERAELGEARETVLGVTIPEEPGAFRKFCSAIGRRVITEFNYRLSQRDQAHIFVGIGTSSKEDAANLSISLNELGYKTVDLSGSEVAKLHVRHMVGGHAVNTEHELLCRFEFPERPGALMHFLDALGDRWNISLFHYRNHGADFGRVLAGFEIPEKDRDQFTVFLEQLRYPYQLELKNSAYDLFLS